MMSGLLRTLLTVLVVAAVVASITVIVPARSAGAQSQGCSVYEDNVSCVVVFKSTYNSTPVSQFLSSGTWTNISTSTTSTPYAINLYLGSVSSANNWSYLQITLIGLDDDTAYTIRGKIGTGTYSVPVTFRTLANLPEAPEQASVARNDDGDQATVTWTEPDSFRSLTKFIIQRAELQRTSGVAVWGKETYFETTDATTLTYTDTGLDPDVTYQYQVAGVSSAGTGFYSATVRTLGAAGENDVDVDDRTYDAIPTPDHGQLPTGYDTSTGDAELVAAVDASLTQIISPTGLTWDPDKMRHFLVVLGSGVVVCLALVGNRKLGNRINGQSILLAFLLFQASLWLGALMLGFPWQWAMLPTLMTVGLGIIAFAKKVTA